MTFDEACKAAKKHATQQNETVYVCFDPPDENYFLMTDFAEISEYKFTVLRICKP